MTNQKGTTELKMRIPKTLMKQLKSEAEEKGHDHAINFYATLIIQKHFERRKK